MRQLLDKHVELSITEDAKSLLAEKGFDPKFGARPLARVIQDDIKRPLADALLFGDLQEGGKVNIDVSNGTFVFHRSGT